MNYVVTVFKARSGTMKFHNFLKKNGIKSSVIATPKSVGSNCGICVKLSCDNYPLCKKMLTRSRIRDFIGFYLITKEGVKVLAIQI